MKLTDNEVKALNKIAKSEYQNDSRNPVDWPVWTSYVNPFSNKRTFSGVISSLVQKGFVVTGGSTADANPEAGCDGTTLAITQSGYDALQAVLKPIRAIEAKMSGKRVKVKIDSVKTVSGFAGDTTQAEAVLIVKGTSDTVEGFRAHVEQACAQHDALVAFVRDAEKRLGLIASAIEVGEKSTKAEAIKWLRLMADSAKNLAAVQS